MDQTNHPLQQVTELRLLAAALELQHLAGTGGNLVRIPGGERVIVVGTPAQVARLIEIAPAARGTTKQRAALQELADQAQELDMGYGPATTDSEGGHHD